MNKQYAVFDWDNTVRDGYTLFDWIKYLINQEIFNRTIQDIIDELSRKYKANELSHDAYAQFACQAYVKEMKGLKYSDIKSIAGRYIEQDKHQIFGGMTEVFNIFYKNKIDLIVISGAAENCVGFYKREFHIHSILAYKERIVNGYFTGQTSYNYGYNKSKTMMQLECKYGTKPLFGFGDSYSDIPLLEEAAHAFSINNVLKKATTIYTVNNSIQEKCIQDILCIIQQLH